MNEKPWLAVFIMTCALGLAVVLDLFQLHMHSAVLAFVRYQQNHHQKFFSWGTSRLCRGDWHSQIWQKIHWII